MTYLSSEWRNLLIKWLFNDLVCVPSKVCLLVVPWRNHTANMKFWTIIFRGNESFTYLQKNFGKCSPTFHYVD